MDIDEVLDGKLLNRFVLIGNPVGHSLSPVMHNKLYEHMAKSCPHFGTWRYSTVLCEDEKSASEQIDKVRLGVYKGMNITMPYKRLALARADYVDPSADAAGGANVLVRKGFDLYAYNTDGTGAVGAIERVSGMSPVGRTVAVCGTGPTSVAIAAAFGAAGAREVCLFSRERAKARSTVERLELSLPQGAVCVLDYASYADAARIIPKADIVVDATPRGMKPDDEAIVDVSLFHEGQVVFDTVYNHGITKILAGARDNGAFAMDGLEMLVEQAALSAEIWEAQMGLDEPVPREVMRLAAEHVLRAKNKG